MAGTILANAILANALVFYQHIAGMHDSIKPLRLVCGHSVPNPRSATLDAWNEILVPIQSEFSGSEVSPVPAVLGLSPRVRGSQSFYDSRLQRPWSIPACAGQPLASACTAPLFPVYPRVCGAAAGSGGGWGAASGLSPRVRGSLVTIKSVRNAVRSIPACAGQPSGRLRRQILIPVYPRVCGAAP